MTLFRKTKPHFDQFPNSAGDGHKAPTEAEGNEDGPMLTAKQIQAKIKREAKEREKELAKEERKQEATRKKEAKALTRKVVSLSSKLNVPLAQAVHKAGEILQKAEFLGLNDNTAVVEFKAKVDIVEDWKKKAAHALAFYSKNPNAELAALPFSNDKEVTSSLKELTKIGNELKTQVINPANKNKDKQ